MYSKILILLISTICSDLVHAKIKVGDPAPDFSLPDQAGKTHTLKDYRGWKVALCFYPKDHTRGCIAQMCSLRNGWEKLQARGITVLGINFDTQAMHDQFAKDQNLNFPLLSDTDQTTGKAYHVKKFLVPNPKRITYLIDDKGNILDVIDNVDTKNHAEQILKHISTAKKPAKKSEPKDAKAKPHHHQPAKKDDKKQKAPNTQAKKDASDHKNK